MGVGVRVPHMARATNTSLM